MLDETILFAILHSDAHIVVIEPTYDEAYAQYCEVYKQLRSFIRVSQPPRLRLRLANDTVLLFVNAAHYERLRGERFDRIEVQEPNLIPPGFLEMLLKSGVTPAQGMLFT